MAAIMSRMNPQNIFRGACLLLVLCVAANCGPLGEQATTGSRSTTANNGMAYYLDSKTSSVTQPLDASMKDVEQSKFVQVEIATVQNPRKQALLFEVHYQPTGNPKILLGSFSLYPLDNPGTFIVPTQGKLKNQGALLLSMTFVDKDDKESVRIGVKKLQLRNK